MLLVVLIATILGLTSILADLDTGYGSARSRSSQWLADHSDSLSEWHRGTFRDLTVFIPTYVVVSVASCIIAVRSWHLSVSLLVIGGAADIAETVLFRRTLTSLRAGTPSAQLAERASTTAFLSGAKWALLLSALFALIIEALRRPR